jgi:Flp pilus assembly protein TadD
LARHRSMPLPRSPRRLTRLAAIAVALLRQRRHDEAVHHFRETVRLDPYHANAHLNLAVLLEDRERFEEARGHYTESFRIQLGDVEARARLQRVEALSYPRR